MYGAMVNSVGGCFAGHGEKQMDTAYPLYIYTHAYVSLFSMYLSLSLFRYLYIYVYTSICIYVHMYICIYVCMYICIYIYIYVCVCMYVCVDVCMHVCRDGYIAEKAQHDTATHDKTEQLVYNVYVQSTICLSRFTSFLFTKLIFCLMFKHLYTHS